MARLAHGDPVTPEQVQEARREVAAGGGGAAGFAAAAAAPEDLQDFGFMFGELQKKKANLLPEQPSTNVGLKRLGRRMEDPGIGAEDDPGDSPIPAVYTYFGQFVDHDITLEKTSFGGLNLLVTPTMVPLSLEQIHRDLKNARTATLELDSLYGPEDQPVPRDPHNNQKLLIGHVTRLPGPRGKPDLRVRLKGDDNDLPRLGRNPIKELDRAARIGDERNDENLVVSQLHLAFLKAHNMLVDQGNTFQQARRLLRQHYQHIVIHDYLRRIADEEIIDGILQQGNKVLDPLAEPFFMPLEFSVAAFRFGHTMIREDYDFNLNFNRRDGFSATLDLLFTFTALSGQLGFGFDPESGTDTLPDNWIIEWHRFVDTLAKAPNKARQFDTKLAFSLATLRRFDGTVFAGDRAILAVRNLLRGYGLRLPTGQAVANFLGLPVLKPADIIRAAASSEQAEVLKTHGFDKQTPLWYYLLAEAKHAGPTGGKGQKLGKVGSTIVAEVLIGLTRRSQDSILNTPQWAPSIPVAHPGHFELADLLRFAEVLPRTHRVKRTDTLPGIAQAKLGDERRWAEIFVLNRDDINHRDRLTTNRVFVLPYDTPAKLRPIVHKSVANDTLRKLAQKHLGDRERWFEIAELNSDVLGPDPNPDQVPRNTELVILPP
jgi:nucleoid-associated protein YgaU